MSHERSKVIHFEGELLPRWAQWLDLAARLCGSPEEMRDWFFRLGNFSGVEDARTVTANCERLRSSLDEQRAEVIAELHRMRSEEPAEQIVGAWTYALDTMIQAASGATQKTCTWIVAGAENDPLDGAGGGTVTLRRV